MSKKQLDRGFEVEWCAELPGDGFGGADFDRAKFVREDFATLEQARLRAIEVYPRDCCGQVVITEFEMLQYEPGYPGKYAEYIGESEYYTGE